MIVKCFINAIEKILPENGTLAGNAISIVFTVLYGCSSPSQTVPMWDTTARYTDRRIKYCVEWIR
jgi:hypothetical protein